MPDAARLRAVPFDRIAYRDGLIDHVVVDGRRMPHKIAAIRHLRDACGFTVPEAFRYLVLLPRVDER